MQRDETDDRLVDQPVPEDASCPYCGADPTAESNAEHLLSDIGYLHDDIVLECSNEGCGEEWTCGVPIGDPSDGYGDDLWCRSCEKRFGRIHRVAPDEADEGEVRLHCKCPNPDCRYFWAVTREFGPQGVALVGYPDISGETEGAKAYGYPDEPDEGEVPDCGLAECIIHGVGTVGCPNNSTE